MVERSRRRQDMNDISTTRMLLTTAALAAVAALFAGGANARLLDTDGGTANGAAAVPSGPGTIPYLSHGIGVDESLWSGEPQTQLSGVHAALQRDRSETTSSVVEPGTIPYLSHGIGVDASLCTRGRGPLRRLGGHPLPAPGRHDGDVRRQRRRLDVLRSRGRRSGTARRRDRGSLPDDAAPRRGCTPVDRPTREPERGDFGGIAPLRWTGALRPQDRAPWACEEARLDEQRQGVALDDRAAVEALDREPPPTIGPHPFDERREGRPEPLGVRVAQRQQRAAAALDVERRLAAQEHDVGSRHARGASGRPPRPGKHAAVGLRRLGGGEHECVALVGVPQLPEPLDGTREGELCAAEPLDEVAAAARTDRLERAKLPVDGAVPARDPFGAHAVTRDDPLPLEQELRERPPVLRT